MSKRTSIIFYHCNRIFFWNKLLISKNTLSTSYPCRYLICEDRIFIVYKCEMSQQYCWICSRKIFMWLFIQQNYLNTENCLISSYFSAIRFTVSFFPSLEPENSICCHDARSLASLANQIADFTLTLWKCAGYYMYRLWCYREFDTVWSYILIFNLFNSDERVGRGMG